MGPDGGMIAASSSCSYVMETDVDQIPVICLAAITTQRDTGSCHFIQVSHLL